MNEPGPSPETLYASIADDLARLIDTGGLRAGMRAPSVRALSRQRGVSMTTALAALRALERRGLIVARPQSGYFVQPRAPRAPEPVVRVPRPRPRPVGISSLLAELVDASRDPAVVQLGAAMPEPGWYPVHALRRAMAAAARARPQVLSEYGTPAGSAALRRAIAARYAETGCPLDADELCITHGCMEALNVALSAVAQPGDVVAVESPTYYGALQILEHRGLKAIEIPTDPRTGLSVEALERVLDAPAGRDVRACLVMPHYSNPLGATMPESSKAALVALCEARGVALIEDDVYGELGHDGTRPRPLKAFERRGGVILCSSFSKTLAPGLRIGWVAGGRYAEAVRLRRYVASIGVPGVAQAAVTAFLDARGYARHLQRLRGRCRDAVERVGDAIVNEFPAGTRLSRPAGGFVLWVELPGGADAVDLFRRARPGGIAFAPGPLFSATGGLRTCLRINCARDWTPRTARAIATLGRLAAE